eukprot:m.68224 g.68224  ORF g.68224 m.68224 type:complete len:555 (+) comp7490_c0_seq1:50-1714(+)
MHDEAAAQATDWSVAQHDISPGQYDNKKTAKSDGAFAPFGGLAPRETIFEIPPAATIGPSPGTYNLKVDKSTVGGSSLGNKSKRFTDPKPAAPPPGAYPVARPLKGQASEQPKLAVRAAGFVQAQLSPGKLGGTGGSASIPARTEPWGYEGDGRGHLVKNLPPRVEEKDIGPGRYNPTTEDHSVTRRYKGSHFGQRTEQRVLTIGVPKDGPPPGAYAPTEGDGQAGAMLLAAKHPAFNTTTERSLGPPVEVVKEAVPGPNSYSLPSTLVKESPSIIQCFGSTQERFAPSETIAPAPGAYDSPVRALKDSRPTTVTWFTQQKSPFLNSCPRFADDPKPKSPGPTSYALDTITMSGMAASRAHAGPSSTFGATGDRIGPFINAEATRVPGPGAYTSESPPAARLPPSRSSRTNIVAAPRPKPDLLDDAPDLGVQGRDPGVSPTVVKQARAHVAPPPFSTAVPRELDILNHGQVGVPAPGAYNPPKSAAVGGRMADHFRERFPSQPRDTPQPGAYNVASPIVKPTFNVTLAAPSASMLASSMPRSPSPALGIVAAPV